MLPCGDCKLPEIDDFRYDMDSYIQYWACFFTVSFFIDVFKQAIMYFGDLSKIHDDQGKGGNNK